jgi:hypothetical protein
MDSTILAAIITGAATIVASVIVITNTAIKKNIASKKKSLRMNITFSGKMERLNVELVKASHEIDSIISEMKISVDSRKKYIEELEYRLKELSLDENRVKEHFGGTKKINEKLIELLDEMFSINEKQSLRSKFIYLFIGLLASTGISFVLKYIFNM